MPDTLETLLNNNTCPIFLVTKSWCAYSETAKQACRTQCRNYEWTYVDIDLYEDSGTMWQIQNSISKCGTQNLTTVPAVFYRGVLLGDSSTISKAIAMLHGA